MPTLDLYYSQSLLGHFTLIVYDRSELIVNRVHMVDRDAEAAHGGKLAWAIHKVQQLTGFATSNVLDDIKSSPAAFEARVNYAAPGRQLLKQWAITVPQMDTMLNWVHQLTEQQNVGHFGSYGYVVYSNNVDNCGSFAIKCLAQAGITVQLSTLKSWIQLPTLIKGDV
ncbi:hypothetical protein [Piscinibacter terrae]|uniref:Uncharacterized protein n=1 Tax=Piscinibacter terrae TaxID=2496871 RepID=A0A3N7J391_9BURK|nr:hypothetical protein [Albitalea terrae]RQP25402.1 hypothetical protein DZC73_11315 [Albitalea terrae]